MPPQFGPLIPGVTTGAAPLTGQQLAMSLLAQKMGGIGAPGGNLLMGLMRPAMGSPMGAPSPQPHDEKQKDSGDKIAEAIQLLRQAGESDKRIAPLVRDALQMLVTGQTSGGPMGAGTPMQQMGPGSMISPVAQQAGLPMGAGLGNLRG